MGQYGRPPLALAGLLVLPFVYLLTRVVPDKFQKSSKTVVCVCVFHIFIVGEHRDFAFCLQVDHNKPQPVDD